MSTSTCHALQNVKAITTKQTSFHLLKKLQTKKTRTKITSQSTDCFFCLPLHKILQKLIPTTFTDLLTKTEMKHRTISTAKMNTYRWCNQGRWQKLDGVNYLKRWLKISPAHN